MTSEAIFTGSEPRRRSFILRTRSASAIGLTPCWLPARTTPSARRMCAPGSMCSRRYRGYGGFGCGTGRRFNRGHKCLVNDRPAPSPNDPTGGLLGFTDSLQHVVFYPLTESLPVVRIAQRLWLIFLCVQRVK